MGTDAATSPVRTEVEGGVATLVLDRPATGNAIDPDLARALRAGAESLAGRDDVRVVVLRAEGKAFCVGGDVRFFAGAEDPEGALRALADDLHGACRALLALDAPVVAAVQGVAAGAGFSLVLGADLVVASEAASFTVAYTGVGLSPDGGASWTLPRIVGVRKATEMLLRNTRVGAAEALDLGILNEVVPAERLGGRIAELAAEIAAGPVAAFGATRRLVREGADRSLDEQFDAERDSIAHRAASLEGQEGITAFAEKRRPRFADAAR